MNFTTNDELAFNVFCVFKSIKLHLTDVKYDCLKYNFKVHCDVNAFLKSNLKSVCHVLLKKYKEDIKYLFLSNLIVNDNLNVFDVVGDDANKIYLEWIDRISNINELFDKELLNVKREYFVPDLNSDFYNLLSSGSISFETLSILDILTGWTDVWLSNKEISKNIVVKSWLIKVKKYSKLLNVDIDELKNIFKKHLERW